MSETKQFSFNDYQELASRTANNEIPKRERLCVCAMGLSEEAGESVGLVKKHIGQGHPLDVKKIIEELGDTLWYMSAFAAELDVSLEDIALNNIEKLRKRYPEGFSSTASINRKV